MFRLIILAGIFAVSSAHMCLLNPRQRGSMEGLDKEGSNDCLLLSGPCGGREEDRITTTWSGDEPYTVIFQKNLDHFNRSTPGYFSINLLVGPGDERELQRVPDNGEPSLHIYTATGDVPLDLPVYGTYVLQVQYVTRNSQAPPVFFQCADMTSSLMSCRV